MPMRTATQKLSLLAVGSGLVLGIIGSAAIISASDRPATERPLTAEEVPTPARNYFIHPDGFFWGYEWDDRRGLLPEQKAATPWYDARWRPFGHCMADEGYEVRVDPSQPFSQADFDEVIRLSTEQFEGRLEVSRSIGSNFQDLEGIAGAFLRCGHQWLLIPYEELEEHGLRYLEPGEIPEP